jgi:hypothetical protein
MQKDQAICIISFEKTTKINNNLTYKGHIGKNNWLGASTHNSAILEKPE